MVVGENYLDNYRVLYTTDHSVNVVLRQQCEIIHGDGSTGIYAFAGSRDTLESIIFPEGSMLKTIGFSAFEGCIKLSSINFTNCQFLTYIGEKAFTNCRILTEVILPPSLSELSGLIFQSCPFSALSVPNSVKHFRGYCLAWCGHLHTLNIEPESQLVSIDSVALIGTALTNIFIPKYVSSIAENAFSGNINIIVDPDSQYLSTSDGILYNKDKSEFILRFKDNMTSFTIPENITTIPYNFFCGSSITSITFNSKLRTIGLRGFYGSHLVNLTIPDTIKTIVGGAFSNCKYLTNVIIGRGISSLPPGCFYGTNISNITLPDNIISLREEAFAKCPNLKTIRIPKSVKNIGGNCFDQDVNLEFEEGAQFSFDSQKLLYDANKTKVFSRFSSLESYDIPSTVKSFSESIFSGLGKLKAINFPSNSSLLSVAYALFDGCNRLEEFICPKSVTHIGVYAFRFCYSLKRFQFPDNLNIADIASFQGCTSLVELRFKNISKTFRLSFAGATSVERIIFEGSAPTMLGQSSFEGCTKLKTVEFKNITCIGQYCFYGCTSLESLVIPDTITTMEPSAFSKLSIENITFLGEPPLTVIKPNTFSGATKLINLILPSSIKEIQDKAFQWTNFSTFTVPHDTHTISNYTLQNCINLKTFIIEDDCSLQTIGFAVFEGCKSLETIICNNSAYFTVENHALFNKNKTVLVVFPPASSCKFFSILTTIREIAAGAFLECKNLMNILIPDDSVQYIRRYAFSGCISLTHINIPLSVIEVETNAFADCIKLTCGVDVENKTESFINNLYENCYLNKNAILECHFITCKKPENRIYFSPLAVIAICASTSLGLF
ncbi:surface antigen BspA-like [Trichomonas vaginalis G3]|uniref:Surface antigen BspA-like n=1 Tax=Trichomonas vaginalis (strain ATCC PRA-98 / G3) TaxID=412133 RepID=A2EDI3_TRIV3|nr:regulation of response to stimulus [Trichomonas vaginalis G3]EAY09248.1 surface antigen BspA-like [Trichomonas vaginalis G3]KAI5484030.1 regulation of response to stimulus [Trichomonas vaginalis G3]|eukprot:XP_001321471.1 surface antigen BspA-like [Trichomonas vaginalis G3]